MIAGGKIMPISARVATITRLRSSLARRLAVNAAFSLMATLAVAVVVAVTAVFALAQSWQALNFGWPLATAGWSLAGLALSLGCLGLLAALRAPSPAPCGVLLPREAAPDFFRLLDEIGSGIGAPPLRRVWIGSEINAVVLQRPRWGVIGPLDAELVIGLPLVHSVSRDQLAAVLAHEFAHLALQRSGWGGFGAFLRAWWLKVIDSLCEHCRFGENLMDRPLRRLYHDMLRLSRFEEYEADACASRLVGRQLLGETLLEVGLKAHFLEHDYWPKVMAQSELRPRPSIRPYREMGLGMEAGFLRAATADELLRRRDRERAWTQLHPGLRQRLRALRVPLRPARDDQPSAARVYFAPLLPALAWVFDREWWDGARGSWRRRYRGAHPR
jgi:hypothetical protein